MRRRGVNRRTLYFRWVRLSRYSMLYPLFWSGFCLVGIVILGWLMTPS